MTWTIKRTMEIDNAVKVDYLSYLSEASVAWTDELEKALLFENEEALRTMDEFREHHGEGYSFSLV